MRPSKLTKKCLYPTSAGLVLTGLLWLLSHYFMKVQGEFGPENHPLEIWSIRLHGLFSVGILLCIGMLIEHHILTYFKRRKHLWTGLTLAITLGWLSISGYLIYYLVDDTWREYTSLAHWVIGLAVIVLFLAHLNVKRFSQAS